MPLIKTAQGVESITGSVAGNVFTADSTGKHVRANPRRVQRCSSAQKRQRDAFRKARKYSTDNRTVSYLIYLTLNGLPFILDAIVTGDPDPDCRGRYLLSESKSGGKYLYHRTDNAWFIFYVADLDRWYIGDDIEAPSIFWWRLTTIKGKYGHTKPEWGNPFVSLAVQPPPPDYNPPNL